MPHTNVRSSWVDGDLYFYDKSGAEICHFDGTNRSLVIPSGSVLSMSGTQQFDDIIGNDASLGITGLAGSGSGTGGAVAITAGASAGASGTGGDVALASGAAAGGTEGAVKVQTVATGKLSFFGVTPATRASAYTQTYATADKTHAAPTAATLTLTDGAGTNDNTIGAITDNASTIAAVQELADEINKLVADVADVKQVVNAIVDDLQAYGLAQ